MSGFIPHNWENLQRIQQEEIRRAAAAERQRQEAAARRDAEQRRQNEAHRHIYQQERNYSPSTGKSRIRNTETGNRGCGYSLLGIFLWAFYRVICAGIDKLESFLGVSFGSGESVPKVADGFIWQFLSIFGLYDWWDIVTCEFVLFLFVIPTLIGFVVEFGADILGVFSFVFSLIKKVWSRLKAKGTA